MASGLWGFIVQDYHIPLPKKVRADFIDYVKIARFDHSTKHVFIIPGIVLAYILRKPTAISYVNILFSILMAVSIASANYVINEYLDRHFDGFHPSKSRRTSVHKEMSGVIVACEWMFLVAIGLYFAVTVGKVTLLAACIFALQGIVYNVKPIRSKDLAYIDVISESINNPVRLIIGWAMIDNATLPPGSILLACWFGGAYLMASKRYSEYREMCSSHGFERLVMYRASFAGYSEVSLNVSCLIYAILSSFFLAVFLIKYRIEYILLFPAIAILFGYYQAIATAPKSPAQNPEKLFKDKKLIILVAILIGLFVFTSMVSIPQIKQFAEQHYIQL